MNTDTQMFIIGMAMSAIGCLWGRIWQYANDRDRIRQLERDTEWFSNELDRIHLHYWNGGDRTEF